MADAEARREARRRKILQNSENRLNRVLGNPLPVENEPVKGGDGVPGESQHLDTSGNATNSKDSQNRQEPEDKPSPRLNSSPEPVTPSDSGSPSSSASVRQRTHRTAPEENQPTGRLPTEEKVPPKSKAGGNGLAGDPGTDASPCADPFKVLDLMRCGGCLLAAFLTRWALSFGLGMLFLELAVVPFILLEASVYYFQTTHLKDIQLPHKSSMMTYALVLSGLKPEVISQYNTIMGYISAVMEDFALYLFAFLVSHAVMA